MEGTDRPPRRGNFGSNLGRSSRHGRPQDFLLRSSAPMKQSLGVAPWPMTMRARTRSILHQMLNGFFLRDLDNESNRFCSLTSAATIHGRMATRRRLGRPLTAVRVAPGGDPTRETARRLRCGSGILLQALNQGEVLRLDGSTAVACLEAAARLGQNPHGEGAIYRGKTI
jgi:hypothetical protein